MRQQYKKISDKFDNLRYYLNQVKPKANGLTVTGNNVFGSEQVVFDLHATLGKYELEAAVADAVALTFEHIDLIVEALKEHESENKFLYDEDFGV